VRLRDWPWEALFTVLLGAVWLVILAMIIQAGRG
jgi:hypothetical protein